MDTVNEKLMTRKEVSEYLKICISCVDRTGIPNFKIGRSVRYRKSDVDNWLIKNTRREDENKKDEQ
ncbi:MAG: helix-turn-helix domain-containing protein [Treponema sp.]|nr:helix-turn-helix domain-containing protein [Treponema sp.]